jgi:putative ABC transport system ATP-binding protein
MFENDPQTPNRLDPRPIIEMDRVVKNYKTPAGEFAALKGVTAAFYQGEFVSVVGKSGSGKSTLINMITGIDHPTSGSVRIGATLLQSMKEGEMAVWRGRNLGIVFQFFQLLPMLTLFENVILPMDFCNMYRPEEREPRAMDLLRLFNLEAFADKMPAELSGGQQQTAAIARSLSNDPPIIVADEPTGNLDSRTAEAVFQLFGDLAARGKTVIMVTHDNSLAQRTSRSLLLFDGELIHEKVARLFPAMPHRWMLALTKKLRPQVIHPGEMLTLPEWDAGLVIVNRGMLQGVLPGPNRIPPTSLYLQPGEWICDRDVDLGPTSNILFQASGEQPVEVLYLDRSSYQKFITETNSGQEGPFPPNPILEQIENRSLRRAE